MFERTITRVILGLAMVSGLCLSPASIAARPVVEVRLTIEDPMYQEYYKPEDYQRFQSDVKNLLREKLSNKIGFLEFTTDTKKQIVLNVRIDAASKDAGPDFREIGFFFEIAGEDLIKNNENTGLVYLRLRRAEDYGDVDEVENEVENIKQVLNDFDTDQIVSNLLHRVPIAKEAEYRKTPLVGWVLPYPKREVCIEQNSLIEVTLGLSYPGMPDPLIRTYAAAAAEDLDGLMLSVAVEPEDVKKTIDSDPPPLNVEVKWIYVKHYVRLPDCDEEKLVDASF